MRFACADLCDDFVRRSRGDDAMELFRLRAHGPGHRTHPTHATRVTSCRPCMYCRRQSQSASPLRRGGRECSRVLGGQAEGGIVPASSAPARTSHGSRVYAHAWKALALSWVWGAYRYPTAGSPSRTARHRPPSLARPARRRRGHWARGGASAASSGNPTAATTAPSAAGQCARPPLTSCTRGCPMGRPRNDEEAEGSWAGAGE